MLLCNFFLICTNVLCAQLYYIVPVLGERGLIQEV